jgi:hypothetical protein
VIAVDPIEERVTSFARTILARHGITEGVRARCFRQPDRRGGASTFTVRVKIGALELDVEVRIELAAVVIMGQAQAAKIVDTLFVLAIDEAIFDVKDAGARCLAEAHRPEGLP